MKDVINKEVIHRIIDNSTWVSNSKMIYTFRNAKELSINGEKFLNYSLSSSGSKISIHIDDKINYYVDFIDDFTLLFYNNNEEFKLKLD